MKLKLCFSALCAAAVILLASPAAYADSYDLSLGSISIDSTASGQTVVQNGKTAVDQAPVITQKSAEATQNTISVHASSGSKAVLTLDGVNIDTSSASDNGSPVSVSGSGSVKLCFRSENTLMAGRVPGIEKSAGGWLEIAGEDDAVLNTTGAPGIGSGFKASDADGKEIPQITPRSGKAALWSSSIPTGNSSAAIPSTLPPVFSNKHYHIIKNAFSQEAFFYYSPAL